MKFLLVQFVLLSLDVCVGIRHQQSLLTQTQFNEQIVLRGSRVSDSKENDQHVGEGDLMKSETEKVRIGRINHFATSLVADERYGALMDSLKFTHSFPNGWDHETIPLNGGTYNSTGWWLGNCVIETLSWSTAQAVSNWMSFDPSSTEDVSSFGAHLNNSGIQYVSHVARAPEGYELFERWELDDFPSSKSKSAVEVTYTPALSVFPLDLTSVAQQAQGDLGIIRVDELIWETTQDLEVEARRWQALFNQAPSKCGNNFCFTRLASQGVLGPALVLASGPQDGIAGIVAFVANSDFTTQKLSEHGESAQSFLGLNWTFYDSSAWKGFQMGQCQKDNWVGSNCRFLS